MIKDRRGRREAAEKGDPCCSPASPTTQLVIGTIPETGRANGAVGALD